MDYGGAEAERHQIRCVPRLQGVRRRRQHAGRGSVCQRHPGVRPLPVQGDVAGDGALYQCQCLLQHKRWSELYSVPVPQSGHGGVGQFDGHKDCGFPSQHQVVQRRAHPVVVPRVRGPHLDAHCERTTAPAVGYGGRGRERCGGAEPVPAGNPRRPGGGGRGGGGRPLR